MEICVVYIKNSFIRKCKNSNLKLNSIPDEENECLIFLEENYEDIQSLFEDLDKLCVSYIIQELDGEEVFLYNIGDGEKEIHFNYDDSEDYDNKDLAKIHRELAEVYENIDEVELYLQVPSL